MTFLVLLLCTMPDTKSVCFKEIFCTFAVLGLDEAFFLLPDGIVKTSVKINPTNISNTIITAFCQFFRPFAVFCM